MRSRRAVDYGTDLEEAANGPTLVRSFAHRDARWCFGCPAFHTGEHAARSHRTRVVLRARRDAPRSGADARRRARHRVYGRRATLVAGELLSHASTISVVARQRGPARAIGAHLAGGHSRRLGAQLGDREDAWA